MCATPREPWVLPSLARQEGCERNPDLPVRSGRWDVAAAGYCCVPRSFISPWLLGLSCHAKPRRTQGKTAKSPRHGKMSL